MNDAGKNKLLRNGLIICFFFVHFLFLIFILVENKAPVFILSLVGIFTFFIFYAYYRSPFLHHHSMDFESWSIVLWVPAGALSAFVLNQKLGLGPILAGSLVGFLASFIPNINKKSFYLSQLPSVLYCGAFVGMTSPAVSNDYTFIFLASLICAVFLMLSKNLLQGVGGKLGTLAFIGVVLATLLYRLFILWI